MKRKRWLPRRTGKDFSGWCARGIPKKTGPKNRKTLDRWHLRFIKQIKYTNTKITQKKNATTTMVMAPLMDRKTLGRIAGRVVWDRTPRRFFSLSQLSDIRVIFASLDLRVLAYTLSIGRKRKDFSPGWDNISLCLLSNRPIYPVYLHSLIAVNS